MNCNMTVTLKADFSIPSGMDLAKIEHAVRRAINESTKNHVGRYPVIRTIALSGTLA